MLILPAPTLFAAHQELCITGLFLLAAGRVQVVYCGRRRLPVCELAAGAVFGCGRHLRLISVTAGCGYVFERGRLAVDGELRLAYTCTQIRVMDGLGAAMEAYAYERQTQKLARLLLTLADEGGRIAMPHKDMAKQYTGGSRENMTQGLAKMDGMIKQGYGEMWIDRRAMEVLAGREG